MELPLFMAYPKETNEQLQLLGDRQHTVRSRIQPNEGEGVKVRRTRVKESNLLSISSHGRRTGRKNEEKRINTR